MTNAKSHDPGVEGAATLKWARSFLVLTLVAALFGLGYLAVGSVGIAQTLLISFLAALLVTLILGLVGGLKMPIGERPSRFHGGPGTAERQGRNVRRRGPDPLPTSCRGGPPTGIPAGGSGPGLPPA